MRLTMLVRTQLAVFAVASLIATGLMAVHFMKLPVLLFGVGRYTVFVDLPTSGGAYASGNVTYRGTPVGRIQAVQLTDTGVRAVLSLDSAVDIPSDVEAHVHSQSAVGEQYIALLPRAPVSPPLQDGDVIPITHTSVPPPIDRLLDATSAGLQAIPRDDLRTVVNEAAVAFGGLGPEISRIIRGSATLAIDARSNLDPLTVLVDQAGPVLDTQRDTSDSIEAWAAHLAIITEQLETSDDALAGLLDKAPPAGDEVRHLFERLRPTLPIVLANLVSVGQVAVTYRDSIEQILVLLPEGTKIFQAGGVAARHTKQDYQGAYLDFNLNINLPPPCTTGFLPAEQVRATVHEDYPDRPDGDIYCRVPQDSSFNVRGARNIPCMTVPGKRAPTVAMCESEEDYIPLNDGFNWKGDPNATLSGQDIPQLAPAGQGPIAPASTPLPIATAEYDPVTGTYVGPDGRVHAQTDLRQTTQQQTWQNMLLPAGG